MRVAWMFKLYADAFAGKIRVFVEVKSDKSGGNVYASVFEVFYTHVGFLSWCGV